MNRRPLAPKASALTRLRHSPQIDDKRNWAKKNVPWFKSLIMLAKASKECQFEGRLRPFSISDLAILTTIGRP